MTVWCHLPTIIRPSLGLRIAALATLCVAIITTLLLTSAPLAGASINQTLSFQGRLLNKTGGVVTDGRYNLQFKIYQGGAGTGAGNPGGTLVWTESHINNDAEGGVQVKNGYFSVNLGSNVALNGVDWNNDTLWLSMSVAGNATACTTFGSSPCVSDGEMLPMKRLTATPFSLNSARLDGLTSSDLIKNQNTGAQVATNFWIDGTGKALGGLQSPSIDSVSAGTLSIGANNANAITVGAVGTTTTFQGSIFGNQSLLLDGTFTTTDNFKLGLAGTLSSSASASQYGLQNQIKFTPTVSSVTSLYGSSTAVTLDGAATVSSFYASYSQLSTAASYTGQITNGYGMRIDAPILGGAGGPDGKKVDNYFGLSIAGTSNGDNTAGTVNNYGLQVAGNIAAANTGGVVNNFGLHVSLGSGAGTGLTKNYGLYITGNGGTGATNWAMYNDSTAANYIQGNVNIGTTSNSGNYALNIQGVAAISTGIVAPSLDTLAAGTLSIGTTTAANVNIGTKASGSSNVTIGSTDTADSGTTTIQAKDSVSINANGTTQATFGNNQVIIGDGTRTGSPSLLTIDGAADTPTVSGDSYLGSMYYDTTLGKVQCYEADGWGACSSAPDNFVTISPEYTNAVMNGADRGTISSDLCSDTLNINDGSSGQPNVCATNETYNFYRWTTTETAAQTRSIYVTYQLPASFKEFIANSTSLMGRTDHTNAIVNYQVYRDNDSGLTACGSAVSVSTGAASSWQTGNASGDADPSSCQFQAGDSILFRINLTTTNGTNAYVSNLNFAFSSK